MYILIDKLIPEYDVRPTELRKRNRKLRALKRGARHATNTDDADNSTATPKTEINYSIVAGPSLGRVDVIREVL